MKTLLKRKVLRLNRKAMTPLAILTFGLHGIRKTNLSLLVSQVYHIEPPGIVTYLMPNGPYVTFLTTRLLLLALAAYSLWGRQSTNLV